MKSLREMTIGELAAHIAEHLRQNLSAGERNDLAKLVRILVLAAGKR